MTWGKGAGTLSFCSTRWRSRSESWPGTIKSSEQLTAKQQGAAHKGQERAEMSNAG